VCASLPPSLPPSLSPSLPPSLSLSTGLAEDVQTIAIPARCKSKGDVFRAKDEVQQAVDRYEEEDTCVI
jgi:hypothetical protein